MLRQVPGIHRRQAATKQAYRICVSNNTYAGTHSGEVNPSGAFLGVCQIPSGTLRGGRGSVHCWAHRLEHAAMNTIYSLEVDPAKTYTHEDWSKGFLADIQLFMFARCWLRDACQSLKPLTVSAIFSFSTWGGSHGHNVHTINTKIFHF